MIVRTCKVRPVARTPSKQSAIIILVSRETMPTRFQIARSKLHFSDFRDREQAISDNLIHIVYGIIAIVNSPILSFARHRKKQQEE